MGQCFDCGAETSVSEKFNPAGDIKTVTFGCGHTFTMGVELSLSRFSEAELRSQLRYANRLAQMQNTRKATRESAQSYVIALEAELKARRA